MKAFVFDGSAKLQEVDQPNPADGEALVKVILAGICKTDIEITKGYMDFQGILGHEFVGKVERATNPELVGKRVVGEINVGCGKCELCAKGLERHCFTRSVMGILNRPGSLAEYTTLPEKNLCLVPDNVSDETAAFVEPLAAGLEILEQVRIEPQSKVLVIGDGRLGLLTSMVLRLTGCDLYAVGKHREKLDILGSLGIKTVLLNEIENMERIFDVVIEASGNPTGWDLAISKIKPRGVLVLKSTYHGAFDFNPAPLVIDEISVVGSRCGQFQPALRLLERGLIDPSPLLTEIFSLQDAEAAFQKAQEKSSLKVLLRA